MRRRTENSVFKICTDEHGKLLLSATRSLGYDIDLKKRIPNNFERNKSSAKRHPKAGCFSALSSAQETHAVRCAHVACPPRGSLKGVILNRLFALRGISQFSGIRLPNALTAIVKVFRLAISLWEKLKMGSCATTLLLNYFLGRRGGASENPFFFLP